MMRKMPPPPLLTTTNLQIVLEDLLPKSVVVEEGQVTGNRKTFSLELLAYGR